MSNAQRSATAADSRREPRQRNGKRQWRLAQVTWADGSYQIKNLDENRTPTVAVRLVALVACSWDSSAATANLTAPAHSSHNHWPKL